MPLRDVRLAGARSTTRSTWCCVSILHEDRFVAGVPGEIALMHEFGVARVTVRKALERLAAERLIRRTPGRGTVPRCR